MTFSVRLTREALEDLQRLEDPLIELALRHGDLGLPNRAVDSIQHEFGILRTNPYTCRRAGHKTPERELIIPFGNAGHVALFEIVGDREVVVMAIRHQREDDYH